jgi:hypothetical protein
LDDRDVAVDVVELVAYDLLVVAGVVDDDNFRVALLAYLVEADDGDTFDDEEAYEVEVVVVEPNEVEEDDDHDVDASLMAEALDLPFRPYDEKEALMAAVAKWEALVVEDEVSVGAFQQVVFLLLKFIYQPLLEYFRYLSILYIFFKE